MKVSTDGCSVPPPPEPEGFSSVGWEALERKLMEITKAREENARRLDVAAEIIASCIEYRKKLDQEYRAIQADMRNPRSRRGEPYNPGIGGSPDVYKAYATQLEDEAAKRRGDSAYK